MKKDFGSSDLMRIAGLAPRKRKPEDLKYGRFNRRLMAFTIDSLFLVLMVPILERVFHYTYGPMPVDFAELQQLVRQQPTTEQAGNLYWGTLYHSGFFRWYFYSMLFQFGFLGVCAGICWWKWEATPGKMIMRLKVVDSRTEGKISILQIMVRVMGYFVSGICLGLGFFWIIVDKRRQGWHDKLADTVVVTVPWKPFKHGKKPEEGTQSEPTPGSQAAGPSDSQAP